MGAPGRMAEPIASSQGTAQPARCTPVGLTDILDMYACYYSPHLKDGLKWLNNMQPTIRSIASMLDILSI